MITIARARASSLQHRNISAVLCWALQTDAELLIRSLERIFHHPALQLQMRQTLQAGTYCRRSERSIRVQLCRRAWT